MAGSLRPNPPPLSNLMAVEIFGTLEKKVSLMALP